MREKKKVFGIIVIILLLVVVCSIMIKERNPKISSGTYISEQENWCRINIDAQNRCFEFTHSWWMSYAERGSVEYRNGNVVLIEKERGEGDRYVFKIIDKETVSFLKAESADIDLMDGTIFKLWSGDQE